MTALLPTSLELDNRRGLNEILTRTNSRLVSYLNCLGYHNTWNGHLESSGNLPRLNDSLLDDNVRSVQFDFHLSDGQNDH